MSQNAKQDKMDAGKQRGGSTSAGASTPSNLSGPGTGGLRSDPVWTPTIGRSTKFEAAVASLRNELPTYESGASQYQQLKNLLQSTPEPLRAHLLASSANLEASHAPYNAERAGMQDVLTSSDSIMAAFRHVWNNLSHFHGQDLRTYMTTYPQGTLNVARAQAAQDMMMTEVVPYLDQVKGQAAAIVNGLPGMNNGLRDMGEAITRLGSLLGISTSAPPAYMVTALKLYGEANGEALKIRNTAASAHGHCAQFGAITPAVPSTFENLFTEIEGIASLIPGDAPGNTSGIIPLLKKLNELDQALALGIDEYREQLRQILHRYLEAVTLFTHRARFWPAYPRLSFRFRSLTCLDTQDPASQDKTDDMYIAWIAITPQGHVSSGIKSLFRFHHQGKHGGLIKLDKDEELHSFETWKGEAFSGELFTVFVTLIERDGKLEAEKEWQRITAEIKKELLTGLGVTANEKTTCAWLNANRARFDLSLKNMVFNWNDDDMMGSRMYEVRTGENGNSLFSPKPTERLDTFDYQNKPKDKTVKVGKYRLTTAWLHQS